MSSESTGSASVLDILGWLEVNKKRLAVGAIVATAIGFSIAAYRYHLREKEIEASSALLQIRPGAGAETSTNLPSAGDYLRVRTRFAGTAAAQRAALLAAGAMFANEKFEDARQQFEQIVKDSPDSPWAAEAAFGLAASLDALDKQPEAVNAYQDVLTRYGTSPVALQAQLALASLYEAQSKPDQAMKIYEEVTKGGTFSSWVSEAATRKARLLAKHPELAKAAVPAASTNAPTLAPAPAPAPAAGTNPAPAPAPAPEPPGQ